MLFVDGFAESAALRLSNAAQVVRGEKLTVAANPMKFLPLRQMTAASVHSKTFISVVIEVIIATERHGKYPRVSRAQLLECFIVPPDAHPRIHRLHHLRLDEVQCPAVVLRQHVIENQLCRRCSR